MYAFVYIFNLRHANASTLLCHKLLHIATFCTFISKIEEKTTGLQALLKSMPQDGDTNHQRFSSNLTPGVYGESFSVHVLITLLSFHSVFEKLHSCLCVLNLGGSDYVVALREVNHSS